MRVAVNNKVAIFLTTFLLLTQPAFGSIIFGGTDCGSWIKNKTDKADNQKIWIAGYVSGLNTAGTAFGDKDWLEKVDSAEQIFLFVDNYCQKNPLKRIESAGQALMFELTKK
jgi:hypothetical protein